MNAERWLVVVVTVAVMTVGPVPVINYIVDPFNVFQSGWLQHAYQPNERFVKIKYLNSNYAKYDSYMFGSSRMGVNHPKVVEKYLPSTKFYNLMVSGGTQYDNLAHLEHFIKRGFVLKNIYLQIDIDVNMEYYKMDDVDYLFTLHPSVTGESTFLYYLKYLIIRPILNIKKKIAVNLKGIDEEDESIFDFFSTGTWFRPIKDALIADNQERYIRNEPTLNDNRIFRYIKDDYADPNIRDLASIVAMCKEHGINLIVFTTPNNFNVMDKLEVNGYLRFLKKLALVTDYWDFSGYNSVTLDNRYYYEESHYRPVVGEMIAARIFHDRTVNVPVDFGYHVTRTNIYDRLQDQLLAIKRRGYGDDQIAGLWDIDLIRSITLADLNNYSLPSKMRGQL